VFGMTDVVVVVGAGSIGQAIARRIGAGRHVILTGRREGDAEATADMFRSAGFEASAAAVDVTDRRSGRGADGARHRGRTRHPSGARRRDVARAGVAGHCCSARMVRS
jgi:NAD(P)-dependent dehydrogenase (short-subunit alcohol dehydrogenase family)